MKTKAQTDTFTNLADLIDEGQSMLMNLEGAGERITGSVRSLVTEIAIVENVIEMSKY